MSAHEIKPGSQLDRAVGAMVGLAVGDALGTTLQFAARDTLPPVTDMVGGGPFDLPPGHWSDATSMALCLAETIIEYETGAVTCENVDWALMNRFRRWWFDACYSLSGLAMGISDTMARSLYHFDVVEDPSNALWDLPKYPVWVNHTNTHCVSNDSLKRLAPVAIRWHGDRGVLREAASRQNAATFHGEEPRDACVLLALLLARAIRGDRTRKILRPRERGRQGKVAEVAAGSWREKSRDEIQATDSVVDTLEAALWAIDHARTPRRHGDEVSRYRHSVLTAVNLGGDASSVGAVTGQLAGALWGLSGIPPEWVETLAHSERIIDLSKDLLDPLRCQKREDWRLLESPDGDPSSRQTRQHAMIKGPWPYRDPEAIRKRAAAARDSSSSRTPTFHAKGDPHD